MRLQKPISSTCLAWSKLQRRHSAFKERRQTKDDEKTELIPVAANGTNKFKKIKFIQIQNISKVKRYRFVLKC